MVEEDIHHLVVCDPDMWAAIQADPGALARFFNHFFFLSDIGWFGLIFEY